jgi:dGTP triphosphohydrolase
MTSMKIPPEFIARMRRAAEAEGKTIQEFMSEMLDAYAKRENAKAKGEPVPPDAHFRRGAAEPLD